MSDSMMTFGSGIRDGYSYWVVGLGYYSANHQELDKVWPERVYTHFVNGLPECVEYGDQLSAKIDNWCGTYIPLPDCGVRLPTSSLLSFLRLISTLFQSLLRVISAIRKWKKWQAF